MTEHDTPTELQRQVRDKYTQAAVAVLQGDTASCCGDQCCDNGAAGAWSGSGLYDARDRTGLPEGAVTASLGCGNPLSVADLHEGETVFDLGSGGGIDVLLSARRVGRTGTAYGLDFSPEMLDLARCNAAEAGASNVEFLHGHIEDIPLPADTVDVIVSNCVINLSVDKPAIFASIHRVLRPGGRIGISDVVAADDHLSAAERAERGGWVGCIAGALSVTEYRRGLQNVRVRGGQHRVHSAGRRRHPLGHHPRRQARELTGRRPGLGGSPRCRRGCTCAAVRPVAVRSWLWTPRRVAIGAGSCGVR